MTFTGISDPIGISADPYLLAQAAVLVLIAAFVCATLSCFVPWYAALRARTTRFLPYYPLLLLAALVCAAASLLFVETLYGAFFFDAMRELGTGALALIAAPLLGAAAVVVALTRRTERQLLWCTALMLPLTVYIIFLLVTMLHALADPLFSIDDLARHAQIVPALLAGACALAAGAAVVAMGMMIRGRKKCDSNQ